MILKWRNGNACKKKNYGDATSLTINPTRTGLGTHSGFHAKHPAP